MSKTKTRLIVTKGAPACGKSTKAAEILKEHGRDKVVIVNKDSLRRALYNGEWSRENDKLTVTVHDDIIRKALKQGKIAISDNTNLGGGHLERLRLIAAECAAEFEILDFTDVPMETCLERDKGRQYWVGEKTIRDVYKKYITKKAEPLEIEYNSSLPDCILCDIDGTIALMNGRGPFEWSKVGTDKYRWTVIDAVSGLAAVRSAEIILVSGRDGSCFDLTKEWLKGCGLGNKQLFMRPAGDNRIDSIIKQEIYENYIKEHYNVIGLFDDRVQMIDHWRSVGLGPVLFDVGDGTEF